ncbi:MAG TPA: translocation/assembly module TamB domain-containing protein [Terriglobales bacterium]
MPILLDQPTTTQAPRRKRRLRLSIGLALFALFLGTGLYLTSDSFRERIRVKVVRELEAITGGRVELGSLGWNLSRLQIDIRNLTIHGLEAPNEIPYFHADHLLVRAKILSLMQKEIGLRYVRVERPVVHIIGYPDGGTNQPRPRMETGASNSPESELFDLRLNRLEIANGLLIWNNREMPMNLAGDSVGVGMRFVAPSNMYDATLHVSKLNLSYKGSPNVISRADAQISLYPKSAELKALHWTTAKSKLELSGKIPDYVKPHLEGSYRATLDMGEAGQLAQLKSLRSGLLDVEGSLKINTTGDYSSSGRLHVKDAVWINDSTRLSGVDAAGNFAVDPDRLVLSRLAAHLLGGSVAGEAQIVHWTSQAETGKQAAQGSGHLSISNVDLTRVQAALGANSKLLSQMKVVSEATGKADLRWTGSAQNLNADFAFDLNAPNDVSPSEVPVHGTVNGSYSGVAQRIDMRQLNIATRWTRLDAVGTLGSTANPKAALQLNINTTNISEFQPLLRAAGYPAAAPVELRGHASFSGVVNGKLNAPTLNGHVQLTDFDTAVALPGSANATATASPVASGAKPITAQEARVHWDSLVGDIFYSSNSVAIRNMLLRHGRASIGANATAGLVKGSFTESSPITVQLKINEANLRELEAVTGLNYPISGTLTAQGSFSGTQHDLRGGGDLLARGGDIYGQPYRTLEAHLNVQGQDLQFTNLLVDLNGAVVDGGAEYNLQNNQFGFDLRGNNVNLAQLSRFVPGRIPVSGTAQFTVNGSGTVDEPTLNANVLMRNVKLNQQPAGDITVTAITRGNELHLTGRSSLQNSALAMDGDISLRGEFPGAVKVNIASLDLNPLLNSYNGNHYPLHTSLNGIVTLSGSFKHPESLAALVEVPQLTATMENLTLHNDGPVRFAVRDRTVNIERFHIVGTDTDLTAAGTVELSGAQTMRVRANGQVNLKLLQSFEPSIVSSGFTDFVLNAAGTIARPDLSGQINVRNAAMSVVDAPNGLSDMNGTLVFAQDRLRVQKLTAVTGGGTLDLGGFITYNNGIYFDLTARGRDVRLRYPEGTSSQGNAELRYVGTAKNALLSGDVLITRFGMSPQFDLALFLTKAKQPLPPPNPDSVVDNIRLDIHVTSTPELRVETSMAKLSGDVDLQVKGTVARPTVLGRVNIAEGDVFFNSTKYHLERGDVLFTNPAKLEPVFNVEASTHVRDYDITLGFHGTPEKLSTTYRSDPPLPSGDILQLLAFGQTPEESQRLNTSQTDMSAASNAILGSALNSVVNSRVQKLFGISQVKIDPTANASENPNAQLLTIQQQISNRVTITYRTNVTQAGNQVFAVEYSINPNVSLLAVRDQYGVFGLDVRIRQRKR